MTSPHRKLAIVTGSSSGIGRALTTILLDRGWDVAGVSRGESPHSHPHYRHAQLDLSNLAAVSREFETHVAPRVGDAGMTRIALVNNAASSALLAPVQTLDATELARLHAVNAVAPTWLMGFVSRHCRTDVALRVVNVSSAAAVRAFPGLAAYGSAKAALRMAGMVLAAEWESTVPFAPTRPNAAILSYEPGTVDTPMQLLARSQSPESFPWVGMFTSMHQRGVLVEPDRPAKEIAEFLEADEQPVFAERRLPQ